LTPDRQLKNICATETGLHAIIAQHNRPAQSDRTPLCQDGNDERNALNTIYGVTYCFISSSILINRDL